MLNSGPITQIQQLNAKIRNHNYFMSTIIYYKNPQLVCTEYIAMRRVRRVNLNMRALRFLFLTNLKYLVMLKTAFSGPKAQYSSTELKFLFINLFTSNLQDFCIPTKHTSLQKIINLATTILSGGRIMCHQKQTSLSVYQRRRWRKSSKSVRTLVEVIG